MKSKLIIFNSISNVFLLLILIIGGISYADTNGLWTLSSDIRSGTFGSNEGGGNYIFPQNLTINSNLAVINKSDLLGNLNIAKNLNVTGSIISNNLTAENGVCIGGVCHKSWDSACNQWVTNNSIN